MPDYEAIENRLYNALIDILEEVIDNDDFIGNGHGFTQFVCRYIINQIKEREIKLTPEQERRKNNQELVHFLRSADFSKLDD